MPTWLVSLLIVVICLSWFTAGWNVKRLVDRRRRLNRRYRPLYTMHPIQMDDSDRLRRLEVRVDDLEEETAV